MRFKTRLVLAIGCMSLIAASNSALAQTAQRRIEPQRQILQRAPAAPAPAAPSLLQRARLSFASAPATRSSPLISEARKYLGTNPTDRKRLWCARFMNFVLKKTGYAGTGSDAARSFAQYGHRIPRPEVGAIAVLTRGKNGGHVGVVTGVDAAGNPIIISGNQGRDKRVGEAVYPRHRVIAYVMPAADRGRPAQAGGVPGSEIDSPISELIAAIRAAERDRAPAGQVAQPAVAPIQRPPVQQQARLAAPVPAPQARNAQPVPLPHARPVMQTEVIPMPSPGPQRIIEQGQRIVPMPVPRPMQRPQQG